MTSDESQENIQDKGWLECHTAEPITEESINRGFDLLQEMEPIDTYNDNTMMLWQLYNLD